MLPFTIGRCLRAEPLERSVDLPARALRMASDWWAGWQRELPMELERRKKTRDRLAALAKAAKAGASNADGTYAGPAAKAHAKLRPKRAAQRPEGAGLRASLGALAVGDSPGMDQDRLSSPGTFFADASSFEDLQMAITDTGESGGTRGCSKLWS